MEDYRALNAKTQKNAYPLLRIQECIDRLGKASNLSSVDLLSGYWQIRLSQDAVAKSAFNTRHGKYEFLVMPFVWFNKCTSDISDVDEFETSPIH